MDQQVDGVAADVARRSGTGGEAQPTTALAGLAGQQGRFLVATLGLAGMTALEQHVGEQAGHRDRGDGRRPGLVRPCQRGPGVVQHVVHLAAPPFVTRRTGAQIVETTAAPLEVGVA